MASSCGLTTAQTICGLYFDSLTFGKRLEKCRIIKQSIPARYTILDLANRISAKAGVTKIEFDKPNRVILNMHPFWIVDCEVSTLQARLRSDLNFAAIFHDAARVAASYIGRIDHNCPNASFSPNFSLGGSARR